MRNTFMICLCLLFFSNLVVPCFADQNIVAKKVTQAPVIDGMSADEVWGQATEYTTFDEVAKINVTLKAVYTDSEIFFLVSYPDADRSDTHKTWEWDKDDEMYKTGPDREDAFVFKWNMEDRLVDLSLKSEDDYKSDIWFWKSCRTDPVGYADDKLDMVSSFEIKNSMVLTGKNGKKMYLLRNKDGGTTAFTDTLYTDYINDQMPGFTVAEPTGSSADIKAKGVWAEGKWTIEFRRALKTGNDDDIQLDPAKNYQFGVSRYEISGKPADPKISQPLYGAGDVSEAFTLNFGE